MPPEGYGKFEVEVHSNGCYTAGGPSKLVGFQTITDTRGREVTNGCRWCSRPRRR